MHNRVSRHAFVRRKRATRSRPQVSANLFDVEVATSHGRVS